MEETILTPDQVAKILQVHPFTVLKFIKQGKLKASKLGRVYRIRSAAVDEFLDEQLEQASQKNQDTPKKRGRIKKQITVDVPKNTEEIPVTEDKPDHPDKTESQGEVPLNGETVLKEKVDAVSQKQKPESNDDSDHYILELKS